MITLASKFSIYVFLIAGLLIFTARCGSSKGVHATQTQCREEIAQIQVGDGFLRILCGCTDPEESSGKVFTKDETLTCHLPTRGSHVIFYSFNNQSPHQIIYTGANGSILSFIFQQQTLSSYVADFKSHEGTYEFFDHFTQGISGKIIVP